MTCSFTAISTVFQSYGAKGRVMMKCCLQSDPVNAEKNFVFSRIAIPVTGIAYHA